MWRLQGYLKDKTISCETYDGIGRDRTEAIYIADQLKEFIGGSGIWTQTVNDDNIVIWERDGFVIKIKQAWGVKKCA